jgi:hypothetical protein
MLVMSALNEPEAKRIAKLVRMLASDYDGEMLAAARRLKDLLKAERLTHHDIAAVIESCNGEIEERKYSDADAEIIFNRGVEKGREEEARKKEQIVPTDYYDADGQPRWNAIATFCQKNHERLRPKEQEFIDDMVGSTMWRVPTEKLGRWLVTIFLQLGGRRAA